MSTTLTDVRRRPIAGARDAEKRHRLLLIAAAATALALCAFFALYGYDYYLLDQAHRPFSAKHAELKPSGTIGLRLGMLGLVLFFLIYLYPIRKRWSWLATKGKTSHWLDFHVVLGLVAPVVITFHSSFKIQGFAGMAYWAMVALTTSGIIGRYLYSLVPRSLGEAAISLKELESANARLQERLEELGAIPPQAIELLFRLPTQEEVRRMQLVTALAAMARLDLARRWHLWRLRNIGHGAAFKAAMSTLSKQSSLSTRILFLSKTQRLFYLWHVIHRPFSVSFAVLVIIHVSVVLLFGYY